MISSSESGNFEISHDCRCVKHFADCRTAVRSCCTMSKTIAVHVRYNFLYISLPSSTKQQRVITKFCASYGTWTTTANFSHFHLELYTVLHVKPEQVLRAINVLNRSKSSWISLVKKIIFTRRRRRRCLSSLKTAGKPNARWLIRERRVASIFQKSSGSPNCFSFLTGHGIKAQPTNCKSAILFVSLLFRSISEFIHLARCVKS